MQRVDMDELFSTLAALALEEKRHLVALAGPPGAGKSHIAEALLRRLDHTAVASTQIVAMDGFHFDDAVLAARGDLMRKGAPHTFDTGGLHATLLRIKADNGQSVAVPVFDRSIEIARAGAQIIAPATRLIIVEGNYLLLDEEAWKPITALFDRSVFIKVPDEIIQQRLLKRWENLSYTESERKLEGNDLPNMRLVLNHSMPADFCVEND